MLLRPKEIVERWGLTFVGQRLPSDMRLMEMGECFANARWLRKESEGRGGLGWPLVYCEGFVSYRPGESEPVHHGWCVDAVGRVVDPTWEYQTARTYTGVAFRSWVLPHYERVHVDGFALLADLEIRSLTAAELEKIVYGKGGRA